MRGWLRICAFCAMVVIPVAAGTQTGRASGGVERGKTFHLRVAASPYEPFAYREGGEERGLDVDLLRLLCTTRGWTYEITWTSFPEIWTLLEEGKADMAIGAIYRSPDRERRFLFTESYLETGLVVAHRIQQEVGSKRDLKGLLLGVKRGATGEGLGARLAPEVGLAGLKVYDDTTASFEALRRGEVDAVLNDYLNTLFLISKEYSGEVAVARGRFGVLFLSRDRLAFPLRKGLEGNRDEIDATLRQLAEGGVLADLQTKWLPVQPPGDWKRLAVFTVSLVALAVVWAVLAVRTSRRKARFESLKDSEKRYRHLIEQAPLGVALLKAGVVTFANEAFLHLFRRLSLAEVIGKPFLDCVAAESRGQAEACLGRGRRAVLPETGAEWQCLKSDGTRFLARVRPVRVEGPEGLMDLLFLEDVTLSREAERALKESREAYRLLVENQTDLVVKVDTEGRFLFVSPTYCRLFGKSEEELLGRTFMPLVHEEDLRKTLEAMKDLYRPPYTCYVEQRAHTAQGWRWLAWSDKAVLDAEGRVQAIVGVGRDVTDRVEAERRLRESERRFRTLIENTHDVVIVFSAEGRALYITPSVTTWTGYSVEELLGNLATDYVAPEDVGVIQDVVRRSLRAPGVSLPAVEYRVRHKNGSLRIFSAIVTNLLGDPAVGGIVVNCRDITERRLAELAVKESEALFRGLAESTEAAIMIYQGENLRYVNRTTELVSGYSREELQRLRFWDLVHPDHREMVRERGLARQRGEPVPRHYEFKVVKKTGEVRWLDFTAAVIQYNGRPAGLATAIDVTDRKRVEEELRRREAQVSLILQNVSEVIYYSSLEGDPPVPRVQFVSHKVREILGLSQEEIQAQDGQWLLGVHPDDVGMVKRAVQALREEGRPFTIEYRFLHGGTQTYRWLEDHAVPEADPLGRVLGFFGVVRDVTDRHEAEEAQQRTNRQLLALLASSQAMAGSLDMGESVSLMCRVAVEIFGVDLVWMGLVVPESTEVQILASAGRDEGYTESVQVRWDESARAQGPAGRAIKLRRPVIMRTEEPDFAPWREEAEKRGFRCVCAVPMLHEDAVRGVVTFYSGESEAFSPEEVEVLEIFARHATMTVVNAALYEEARRSIEDLHKTLTELETSRDALQASESRYRALVENARGIVLTFTPDLTVTYWNEFAEEFFGYRKEEILGRSLIGTIVPKEDSTGQDLEDLLKRIAADPNAFASNINQNVRKDGRRVWVAWTNRPVLDAHGRVSVVLSHGTDVTSLKEAEISLRGQESRYRTLLELSPGATVVADLTGRITMVNRRTMEIWGARAHEELVGRSVFEMVSEQEGGAVRQAMEQALRGEEVRNFRANVLRKDGQPFPAEINAALLRDEWGSPEGFVGVVRDVSDEVRTRENLEKTLRIYQSLAESARDFIFIVSREERVTFANPSTAAALKLRPEEVPGSRLEDLFEGVTLRRMKTSLGEAFRTGEVLVRVEELDFPVGRLWLDTQLIPIQEADGTVTSVLGVSRRILGGLDGAMADGRTRE
ncbi:MAG: PAS domain S-box protein [Acidobacteriota bacterium]